VSCRHSHSEQAQGGRQKLTDRQNILKRSDDCPKGSEDNNLNKTSLYFPTNIIGTKKSSQFSKANSICFLFDCNQSNFLIHQCCQVEVQVAAQLENPVLLDP
jgi:hypothetical protein